MRKTAIFLMCAVMLLGFCGCHDKTGSPHHVLTVHMIDVGEADCFLMIQGDMTMLVDAGSPTDEEKIVSYVASLGIDRLDYVLMTHPHADHMGAMEGILSAFEVGELLYTDVPSELVNGTLLHKRLENAVNEKHISVRNVSSLTQVPFGEATVTVYPLKGDYDDVNDYSAVCMLTFADKRLLMTGDVTEKRIMQMIHAGYDLKADVLKFPHHGAYVSCSEALLDAVKPQYVLFSCDSDKEESHPARKVLNDVVSRGMTVFRTDRDKTVKMEMTRDGVFFETFR